MAPDEYRMLCDWLERVEAKLDAAVREKADKKEVAELRAWLVRCVIGFIGALIAIVAYFAAPHIGH